MIVPFDSAFVHSVQAPISFGQYCRRYVALTPEQLPVELCVLTAACRELRSWDQISRQVRVALPVRLKSVRHVLDADLAHDPPFVVLELRPPGSLNLRQQRSPLSVPEILELGIAISEATSEAHRLGSVVGVISPETIGFRETGEWFIDISGLPEQTPAADIRGSGSESSESSELSAASDVSGLAAVLAALLVAAPDSTSDSRRIGVEQLLRDFLIPDPDSRPSAARLRSRLCELLLPVPTAHSSPFAGTIISVNGAENDPEKTFIAVTAPVIPFLPNAARSCLGRFELTEKLGEGASGIVYRAVDTSDAATVAVKVLNPLVAAGDGAVRRFAREARLLAQVRHPCVARLLEFNQDHGTYFLAIEFVPGGTLGQALRESSNFEEPVALRFAADAVRGLSIAHELGIVHRDIKPDNLLLSSTGQKFVQALLASRAGNVTAESDLLPDPTEPLVKLADFGLARIEQQSESMAITHAGTIMGTPLYMSPEQCRGEVVDPRTDVYAMGATLFHLLAGRPPFHGESHVAVINQQCHEVPPSLSSICPNVSEAVSRLVERCLAKNPDARYPTAGELLADLEQLLHGQPTSLRLHPVTPVSSAGEVLEFRFSCDLQSSPAQLWPYISNTDRVNHALGLPAVRYTSRVDSERGNQRFAEMRLAGQRLAWQEHPYEWIEGRRMSVLREFSSGPFSWFVSIVELQPLSGGATRLVQTLRVAPKSWLGRCIAKFQLGRRSPRGFSSVYRQIDQFLLQSADSRAGSDPFGKPATISRSGAALLHRRLEALRRCSIDPVVAESLGQFLQHGADQDVARIRPLAFAERFQLDPRQVVSACLLGAREGLLVLLWDILCPSCQIPADVQETLSALQNHSYCPACDLRYEVDFANSVELIFRAHPELRTVETKTYCIGGPAFSSHVVAQIRMAPDERFALELQLGEGDYRVRGPQLPFAVNVAVSPSGTVGRWELPLLRPPRPDLVPRLRAGSQVITLHNNTPRELQVRLERTASRRTALTAAAASALALFRELFPDQVLTPGQIVTMSNVSLLLVDLPWAAALYGEVGDGPAFGEVRAALAAVETVARQWGGAVVKITGEGALTTFSDAVSALKSARQLLRESQNARPYRMAVHRGPALVTTINDRLDYFGNTVLVARNLLALAEAGEIVLTEDVAVDPEANEILNGLITEIPVAARGCGERLIFRCRTASP